VQRARELEHEPHGDRIRLVSTALEEWVGHDVRPGAGISARVSSAAGRALQPLAF
jgi:hypothetical protein